MLPAVLVVNRRYLVALVAATALTAVAVGIPTDVLPNPWFTRMTPVRPMDVILWPLISLSVGALLATYALPRAGGAGLSASAGGGLLGAFAVGCPVCNKLVVLVLGFSGALTYFQPIQPLLGLASIALSLVVLRKRIVALRRGCLTAERPPSCAAAPGTLRW